MVFTVGRRLVGLLALIGLLNGQARSVEPEVEEQAAKEDGLMPAYQVQVRGTALEQPILPAEYIVGPGDQFIVSILGPEPYLELVTVTPTGALVLPGVGPVPVEGISAEAVSERVLAFIRDLFPTYEASCSLYGIREIRVSVSGAVRWPGFQDVTPLSRLTDLIDAAGGVRPHAALHRIRLHRGSESSSTLDLTAYYADGVLSENPLLQSGDRIIIPYGEVSTDLVLVQGLGTGPAYHAVRTDETLATFMRRTVHGKKADLAGVVLQRAGQGGSAALEQVRSDRFDSVALQPGDVLFINPIADIAVVGEVRRPGRFAYQPGLKAEDYVVYAGGVNRDGSARGIQITRSSGQTVRGGDEEVHAGDTIHVARSFNSVFLGQLGMVQAALTFLNIFLAYLAATS